MLGTLGISRDVILAGKEVCEKSQDKEKELNGPCNKLVG